jgi:exosortase A
MLAEGSITLAVPNSRQWILPLSGIGLLSLLWGFLFRDAIAAAVQTWWISPTYSHCFLILPVAAYLIWLKRHELACMEPQANFWSLLLALPAGMGWMIGTLASINEVEQLSAILAYQMVLLAMLGLSVYRALLFPALLLFFLVPVGQYLVPPLQHLTTSFVSAGLSTLNILHYTEGNVIELENGRFLVAEACAGLRFLISNIVLCVIFSYFAFRQPLKILLFLVAAVIVPIVANCLRALGIVLIAHWTNNRLAVGTDHLVYGWGFSVLILLMLFGAAVQFRDTAMDDRPLIYWREFKPQSSGQYLLAVAAAATLLLLPMGLTQAQAALFPAMAPAFDSAIKTGWERAAISKRWAPQFSGAQKDLHFAIRQAGKAPVDVLYAYYQGTAHVAAMPETQLWDERKYNLVGRDTVQEQGQGADYRFRELVLASPVERRLVWWIYWKDGRFTTSNFTIKLLALADAVKPHTGLAILAISTTVKDGDEQARARLKAALWSATKLTVPGRAD